MRVLLGCSLGGAGHLMPVTAAAHALGQLGHEVVVLVPPSLAERAVDARLNVIVGAEPPNGVVGQIWSQVRRGPQEQVAGLVDREVFARHATEAMLAPAQAVAERLQPDVAELLAEMGRSQ